MALQVVAQEPEAFDAWRQAQLRPAQAAAADEAEPGKAAFMTRCADCHTVRGTLAGGRLGPDLTHLMSRQTIAAGVLPNTPGNLAAWIADPQGIKPGARMPSLELDGPELTAIRQYLQTLK